MYISKNFKRCPCNAEQMQSTCIYGQSVKDLTRDGSSIEVTLALVCHC